MTSARLPDAIGLSAAWHAFLCKLKGSFRYHEFASLVLHPASPVKGSYRIANVVAVDAPLVSAEVQFVPGNRAISEVGNDFKDQRGMVGERSFTRSRLAR